MSHPTEEDISSPPIDALTDRHLPTNTASAPDSGEGGVKTKTSTESDHSVPSSEDCFDTLRFDPRLFESIVSTIPTKPVSNAEETISRRTAAAEGVVESHQATFQCQNKSEMSLEAESAPPSQTLQDPKVSPPNRFSRSFEMWIPPANIVDEAKRESKMRAALGLPTFTRATLALTSPSYALPIPSTELSLETVRRTDEERRRRWRVQRFGSRTSAWVSTPDLPFRCRSPEKVSVRSSSCERGSWAAGPRRSNIQTSNLASEDISLTPDLAPATSKPSICYDLITFGDEIEVYQPPAQSNMSPVTTSTPSPVPSSSSCNSSPFDDYVFSSASLQESSTSVEFDSDDLDNIVLRRAVKVGYSTGTFPWKPYPGSPIEDHALDLTQKTWDTCEDNSVRDPRGHSTYSERLPDSDGHSSTIDLEAPLRLSCLVQGCNQQFASVNEAMSHMHMHEEEGIFNPRIAWTVSGGREVREATLTDVVAIHDDETTGFVDNPSQMPISVEVGPQEMASDCGKDVLLTLKEFPSLIAEQNAGFDYARVTAVGDAYGDDTLPICVVTPIEQTDVLRELDSASALDYLQDETGQNPLMHASAKGLAYSALAGLASRLERHLLSKVWRSQAFADNTHAQEMANMLKTILDLVPLSTPTKATLTATLFRLSRARQIYPKYTVLDDLRLIGQYPLTTGGFGDVWKGEIYGRVVSVKAAKMYQHSDLETVKKAFIKEATIWSQLSHQNVLPFYGMYLINNHGLKNVCLISPWMANGNVVQYLKERPGADRERLALDIATGLQYLHDNNVVHGDLKGANILVTPSGRACLCDFGLSTIIFDPSVLLWTHSRTTTRSVAGTVPWQAPEIFTCTPNSTFTDIYALGCVYYELYTGMAPFQDVTKHDAAIMLKVLNGERPELPACLHDDIRHLIAMCWAQIPEDRPEMPTIVELFMCLTGRTTGMHSNLDWDPNEHTEMRARMHGEVVLGSVAHFEEIIAGYLES